MIKIIEPFEPQNKLVFSQLEPRVLYRRFVGYGCRFEGYLIKTPGYSICFYLSGSMDVFTATSPFDNNQFERVTTPVTLENIN
jgi:hypothetical protein